MRQLSLGVVATLGLATIAHADTVVVTADRMIDVIAGRVVEHPRSPSSMAASRRSRRRARRVPDGARRVDLPGVTLLPGLIDMHVHLTCDPRFGGYRRLEFTDCSGPSSASPMQSARSMPASPRYATSAPATMTTWR